MISMDSKLPSSVLDTLKVSNNDLPWPELKSIIGQNFDDNYFNICKVVISRINPVTVANEEQEKILDQIILKPCPELLIFVTSSLAIEKEPSYKRNRLIHLLEAFIYEKNLLKELILRECDSRSSQLSATSCRLVSLLISIPDLVANVCKLDIPRKLSMVNYFPRLSKVIFSSLQTCKTRVFNGRDTSLEFISRTIGKMYIHGHSELLWINLVSKLVQESQSDFIWRRISSRVLISTQNDQIVELVIRSLFLNCENASQISLIVSKVTSNVSSLLTKKFVVISSFSGVKMSKNLVEFLKSDLKVLFSPAIKNGLEAWSSHKLLQFRTQNQNLYICSILIHSLPYLELVDQEDKLELSKLVMAGIEDRISCPSSSIRDLGLWIGQKFLRALNPDGPKIDFELDESSNPDILFLKRIMDGHQGQQDVELNVSKGSKPKLIEVVGDDELDDEFNEPEVKATFDTLAKVKKPLYLNDAIDGLGDMDNPEWSITCLESLENLLRKNQLAAAENAIKVSKIVLHLNNDGDVEGDNKVQGHRIRSMVAACVSNPIQVAEFLIHSFYDQNSNMSHRLDILQVLVLASQELSNSNLVTNMFQNLDIEDQGHRSDHNQELEQKFEVPKEVLAVEKSWRQIVDERIKSRTRKVTSATPEVLIGQENKFAKIAGHFFYPLIQRFDGSEIILHLDTFDTIILSRLIYTLSLILISVSKQFVARKMSQSLLIFISDYVHHQDLSVKKSLIFAFGSILTSCPSVYLIQELFQELEFFKSWILKMAENDPDNDLRNNCVQIINLLNQVIEINQEM